MKEKCELCLRLSPEQMARLNSDVERCGLTRSAYLRRLISGVEIKARPPKQLSDLYTEVNKIGTNINQIARKVNADLATKEDIQDLRTLMIAIAHAVSKVAYG